MYTKAAISGSAAPDPLLYYQSRPYLLREGCRRAVLRAFARGIIYYRFVIYFHDPNDTRYVIYHRFGILLCPDRGVVRVDYGLPRPTGRHGRFLRGKVNRERGKGGVKRGGGKTI